MYQLVEIEDGMGLLVSKRLSLGAERLFLTVRALEAPSAEGGQRYCGSGDW